ncbi:MAG: Cytochrome c-552 precursor [Verrucomicrobiota bacterium]
MKTNLRLSPWILALVLAAGCGKPAAPEAPKAAAPAAAKTEAPADAPKLTGVIQDILPARSSLVIKHEAIPGMMGAMTMAFRVDAATLQAAQKGQAITGEVSNSGGMAFTLSNVKLGPAPAANPTAQTATAPAAAPTMSMPMNMPMNMPMGQAMGSGQAMPMMPAMDMPMPAAPASTPSATAAPSALSAPAPAGADVLAAGAGVYSRICIICHQPAGTGIPAVFPPLAGSPIVDGDARRLIRIVLFGLQGPVQVNGTTYNNVMPGHAPTLNDSDIAAVLSYVRNSWGHAAPAVTAAAVATERALNRTTAWTWAELAGP